MKDRLLEAKMEIERLKKSLETQKERNATLESRDSTHKRERDFARAENQRNEKKIHELERRVEMALEQVDWFRNRLSLYIDIRTSEPDPTPIEARNRAEADTALSRTAIMFPMASEETLRIQHSRRTAELARSLQILRDYGKLPTTLDKC